MHLLPVRTAAGPRLASRASLHSRAYAHNHEDKFKSGVCRTPRAKKVHCPRKGRSRPFRFHTVAWC